MGCWRILSFGWSKLDLKSDELDKDTRMRSASFLAKLRYWEDLKLSTCRKQLLVWNSELLLVVKPPCPWNNIYTDLELISLSIFILVNNPSYTRTRWNQPKSSKVFKFDIKSISNIIIFKNKISNVPFQSSHQQQSITHAAGKWLSLGLIQNSSTIQISFPIDDAHFTKRSQLGSWGRKWALRHSYCLLSPCLYLKRDASHFQFWEYSPHACVLCATWELTNLRTLHHILYTHSSR